MHAVLLGRRTINCTSHELLVLSLPLPRHGYCMGTEALQSHVQCDVYVIGCTHVKHVNRHSCIGPINRSAAVLDVMDSALIMIKDCTVAECMCIHFSSTLYKSSQRQPRIQCFS